MLIFLLFIALSVCGSTAVLFSDDVRTVCTLFNLPLEPH
jgi:hypothetical protein